MNDPSDAAIETLLRKQFDGPVADDGFSDQVMRRLPPRRRRKVWPVWGGLIAGIVACWLGLLRAQLLFAGWSGWQSGAWSTPAVALMLVTAAISLLALCWGVGEPDNG